MTDNKKDSITIQIYRDEEKMRIESTFNRIETLGFLNRAMYVLNDSSYDINTKEE